jgi:uncharacterized membrane protein YbhN (UPF0104 family)
MRTRVVRWAARAAVLAILAVLLQRLGAAPFLAGLQRIDPPAVLAAVALTAVATGASAWRWTVLARAFGLSIPLRRAVPAYYRSQFLNSVLPGGMTGDVDRGLTGSAGGRGARLRVVGWDRGIGQTVQLVIVAVVLVTLDSPLRAPALWVVLAVVPALVLLMVAAARPAARPGGRLGRLGAALHAGRWRDLLAPSVLIPATVASVVVTVAHACVFLIAAGLTDAPADPVRLLPLALAVQVAMAFPSGFGGWGPREGVAAATFGAAGLGAANGVAAGTAYGALALIAVLPGALVLVLARARIPGRSPAIEAPPAPGREAER